jgi:hypothetical protein
LQERQLQPQLRGQRRDCRDALDDLRGGVASIGLRLIQRHAPAQQVPHLPVAGPRAGARQDQIPEACRARQRLGQDAVTVAQRGSQEHQLAEAARDQRSARRLAKAQRLGQAGGDGDDALPRPAELDPGDVDGLADFQGRARQQLPEPGRGRRGLAGDDSVGGPIARQITSQQRSAQHGQIGGRDLRQQRAQLADRGQWPL